MKKELDELLGKIRREKLFLFLFLLLLVYVATALVFRTYGQISPSSFLIVVLVSGAVYVAQKKANFYFPFILAGAALLLFSYWNQTFVEEVKYSLFYFLGFSFFVGSMVYAIKKNKLKLFWITVMLFVVVSSLPIIGPGIPVGDEGGHLGTLKQFESNQLTPAQFGEHHYINISPFYFFCLTAFSKVMGVSTADIFYLLKIAFVLLIFLSFYLLSTQFSDKRLAAFVALLAYFPVRLEHFAPQMLGKFLLLNLFIYTYLKYFREVKSRLFLLVLIILLVYVNITTLYISFAVFSFLVLIFFFQRALKRKAYATDLVVVGIFVVLLLTHLVSINFFELDFFQQVTGSSNAPGLLEGASLPRGAETIQGIGAGAGGGIPAEETIPSHFFGFFENYIRGFGVTPFFVYLFYHLIITLMVVVVFFRFKEKRILAYYSLGFLALIFGLILIGFRDGVHATILAMSLVFFLSMVVIFSKKKHYITMLVLLFLAFSAMPFPFNENQPRQAFRGFEVFAGRNGFFGERTVPVELERKSVFDVWQSSNEAYLIGCSPGRSYSVFFQDRTKPLGEGQAPDAYEVRCDSLGRIGRAGRVVYSDPLITGYLVESRELAKVFSALK